MRFETKSPIKPSSRYRRSQGLLRRYSRRPQPRINAAVLEAAIGATTLRSVAPFSAAIGPAGTTSPQVRRRRANHSPLRLPRKPLPRRVLSSRSLNQPPPMINVAMMEAATGATIRSPAAPCSEAIVRVETTRQPAGQCRATRVRPLRLRVRRTGGAAATTETEDATSTFGYGAFGLGYFYYDPYTWYPPSYYGGYDNGYGGYYGGYFDVGEVRLSVSPRSADVYVDGYFAGRVDDFDGVFQALRLESGPHHIQIVAPGYAPLDVDIRVDPGRKITYRGDLRPIRP